VCMKSAGLRKLLKNRRALSDVISNMILLAGVIVIGFIMMVWSQNQAATYNAQYSSAINSNTEQLRERIAFEYIYYNGTSNTLKVYLMNSGTIGKVSIANVYVDNRQYAPALESLPSLADASSLNATQEGFFQISPSPSLGLLTNHQIIIVTGRGSSFAATFAT
jgi:hypothetical protein